MKRMWMLVAVFAAVSVVAPSDSLAQQSNFGTVALRPGFTPDPHVVAGTSGGQTEARRINPSCRGWVSSNPDHIFQANGAFNFMRIFATSDQDTTLVVQTPDGQIRCNDDTYGRNPMVEGFFGPGTYRIWIGSYRQGVNARYQLNFTELRSVTGQNGGRANNNNNNNQQNYGNQNLGSGASQLDMSGRQSNFQDTWLNPGFTPDPQRLSGTSGGQVEASRVQSSCRGWIARRPDHMMNLQGNFGFFRVFVTSNSDTTLVIRTPDGRFLCNDDTYGTNPAISQNHWMPGQYQVWVGSYSRGGNSSYSIGMTELSSVTR